MIRLQAERGNSGPTALMMCQYIGVRPVHFLQIISSWMRVIFVSGLYLLSKWCGATFHFAWQASQVTTTTSRTVRSSRRISNFNPNVTGSYGIMEHTMNMQGVRK